MSRTGKALLVAGLVLQAASLIILLIFHQPSDEGTAKRVRQHGEIVVLTSNNAHCYYSYRDEPMGFEYELARRFADELGVDLVVRTPDWKDKIQGLKDGEGDFIAANLTIPTARKAGIDDCVPYLKIRQHVILHQGNREIKRVADLAGRKVHIRRDSSGHHRLEELKKEGIALEIVLNDDVSTEELLSRVAAGKIAVTVADSNVARLNRRYYPDLQMAFPLSEPESIAWAVRRGDRWLKKRINDFFHKIQADGTFDRLYNRYYSNVEVFDYVDLKVYHKRLETRLPEYQSLIQEEAEKYGFDWRLITALIYQESHFSPRAKSPTGARGLMQLTQRTAQAMGVKNRLDPGQSLRGGVRYLHTLYRRLEDVESDRDRILLAMAGYNVGYGHVRDAQEIARRKGLDPTRWASVKKTLPLLQQRRYFLKSQHGYCRGSAPVQYIDRILTYYDILRRRDIEYLDEN